MGKSVLGNVIAIASRESIDYLAFRNAVRRAYEPEATRLQKATQ